MRFGLVNGKKRTGAQVYTLAFQIASLLPLPYILVLAGYAGLLIRRGALSFLFDLGCALLPRWEAFALSAVYGKTGGEPLVYFLILGFALAFGFVMDRLLRAGAEKAAAVRVVLCVLIAAELVLRIFTPRFDAVFGAGVSIAGFMFRFVCLALLMADLIAGRKATN